MRTIPITLVLLIGSLTIRHVWAQQSGTVDDKDIKVVSFEKMKYPVMGLTARIHGLVVVQVRLDDEGKVVDATAISGNEVLVPDTLANVKKWCFSPNAQKTAVVVYNFTLEGGCYQPDTFTLEGRNLAVVVAHGFMINK